MTANTRISHKKKPAEIARDLGGLSSPAEYTYSRLTVIPFGSSVVFERPSVTIETALPDDSALLPLRMKVMSTH